MPTTSSSTIWQTLWLPLAGVVVIAVETAPGAVIAGGLGALFYAVRGIGATPEYRAWHFFRALFSGVVAAVLVGLLAAAGVPGYLPGLDGAALAAITGFAATLGADGLEFLGRIAFTLATPKDRKPPQ